MMLLLRKGYRFKLKTDPAIEAALVRQAGCARFVWNKALELNLRRLDAGQPILRYADLWRLLKLWKRSEERVPLATAHAQVLQQKLSDLDRAFSDAFDKSQPLKRMPVFKKRGRDDSFRYPQGFKLEGNRIYLPKIGWVRFFKSREIEGVLKNVTVSRSADGWFISIQTEMEVPAPVHPSTTYEALDLGIQVLAATARGELYEPLHSLRNRLRQLARLQRKLARQKKFSANWRKTVQRIRRLHRRIADARLGYLHKLSTLMSNNHAVTVVENLRIANMTRSAKGTVEKLGRNVAQKSRLNRAILDQGWGLFIRMLEYKQNWRGGLLLKVPPMNSSIECSECGHIALANRPVRELLRCMRCGHEKHADIHAARNLLRRGLKLFGLSEENIERRMNELPEGIRYKPVEGKSAGSPVKQEPAGTRKVVPLPA
jgi:putative transposase